MSLDVPVLLNRAVVEHDVALVVGPVLPHEVVGISGGNKYFFPGVGGKKIIDVSHWLGALITSAEIIGTTRHHPGPRADRRRCALIPREAGAVRGHRRSRGRRGRRRRGRTVRATGREPAALRVVRRHPGLLGVGRRGVRGDPRHLPRRPGPPGAVDHPGDVRRDLDRARRASTSSSRWSPTAAR